MYKRQAVGQKIAAIMGVEAQPQERMVAFVACRGTRDKVKLEYEYEGLHDCRMLSFVPNGGAKSCTFGCLDVYKRQSRGRGVRVRILHRFRNGKGD